MVVELETNILTGIGNYDLLEREVMGMADSRFQIHDINNPRIHDERVINPIDFSYT